MLITVTTDLNCENHFFFQQMSLKGNSSSKIEGLAPSYDACSKLRPQIYIEESSLPIYLWLRLTFSEVTLEAPFLFIFRFELEGFDTKGINLLNRVD